MPLDNHKIQRLRADVPALAHQIYVNWGGGGPSSKSILHEMDKFTKRELELGSFHPKIRNETTKALKRTRESCAKLIDAEASEIALTGNTTVGINIAASGLTWNSGDEVIVSDLEHPGGYLPWLVWRKRNPIKVKLFKTGQNDEQLLQNLENAITPNTRVVCVSHISWLNGRRLPLAAIGRICVSAGALLIVDGAQSVGHIPVKIKDTGVDVYTISGQKWLMGPDGTGAVYIRRGAGKKIQLSSASFRSAEKKRLKTLSFTPEPSAMRYEVGTLNTPGFIGLRTAVEHFKRTGPVSIEIRILALANRLLSQIRGSRNVEVITPEGEAQSGLVSFRIKNVESQNVVDRLYRKHQIILRAVVTEPPAVRVSIHYLNTEEEMDSIANAIATIAAGRRKQ
ncbi:MAG: aminotransferase class V-fold PLP-dependent enzyme [Nitrospinae bacterium]|nr:aminotransferase class V-fold PLP-dependent enzyme [Nitrospinota bacterium]